MLAEACLLIKACLTSSLYLYFKISFIEHCRIRRAFFVPCLCRLKRMKLTDSSPSTQIHRLIEKLVFYLSLIVVSGNKHSIYSSCRTMVASFRSISVQSLLLILLQLLWLRFQFLIGKSLMALSPNPSQTVQLSLPHSPCKHTCRSSLVKQPETRTFSHFFTFFSSLRN